MNGATDGEVVIAQMHGKCASKHLDGKGGRLRAIAHYCKF